MKSKLYKLTSHTPELWDLPLHDSLAKETSNLRKCQIINRIVCIYETYGKEITGKDYTSSQQNCITVISTLKVLKIQIFGIWSDRDGI